MIQQLAVLAYPYLCITSIIEATYYSTTIMMQIYCALQNSKFGQILLH